MPPPTRGNYDHYIECKYCGRKYAPEVAEKHIPKCANIINKPGGIKPSKIQDKYIGNSGAQGSKIVAQKPTPVITQQKPVQVATQQKPATNSISSPVKLASKPQMLSKNVKR